MDCKSYFSFYPSVPFWAVSSPNINGISDNSVFYKKMAETAFLNQNNKFTIQICRDGKIMLHLTELEKTNNSGSPSLEHIIKKKRTYLEYLNAFYLILDSETIRIDRRSHFNLHEITIKDIISFSQLPGGGFIETPNHESISSYFNNGRHLSCYSRDTPLSFDQRILTRIPISLAAIESACAVFEKASKSDELVKRLASFTKSLSEYKIGNYETSLVLSWFVIEVLINKKWTQHHNDLQQRISKIRKKENKHFDPFARKDLKISVCSNLLALWGKLSLDQFQDISAARQLRNNIVHGNTITPSADDAQLAMNVALDLIDSHWHIRLSPSMGYST
jgi:hypothetical protein